MTGSERLGMIPLSYNCEADFVSRSNLVEGHRIAAHLLGARNDIRGFSLVLHGTLKGALQSLEVRNSLDTQDKAESEARTKLNPLYKSGKGILY